MFSGIKGIIIWVVEEGYVLLVIVKLVSVEDVSLFFSGIIFGFSFDLIYVMNVKGILVVVSNWDMLVIIVGCDYSDCEYF